jgi:hypothetical protein
MYRKLDRVTLESFRPEHCLLVNTVYPAGLTPGYDCRVRGSILWKVLMMRYVFRQRLADLESAKPLMQLRLTMWAVTEDHARAVLGWL